MKIFATSRQRSFSLLSSPQFLLPTRNILHSRARSKILSNFPSNFLFVN